MGLHETFEINGVRIDFSQELPEESYVSIVEYLFQDANTKPKSNFFYKKISEDSYVKIFYGLKENKAMLDFLERLFLLSKENLTKETQREFEFFFNYYKTKDP